MVPKSWYTCMYFEVATNLEWNGGVLSLYTSDKNVPVVN